MNLNTITKFLIKASTQYSKITIVIALLIAALSIIHATLYLKFDTNQDNLISKKQKYLTDYTDFLKEFGDWEYVYVVIKVPDDQMTTSEVSSEKYVYGHDQAKKLSDLLTESLRKRPDLFTEVTHKIDLHAIKNNFLLYAPQTDFDNFVSFTQENTQTISDFLNIKSAADWYRFLGIIFSSELKSESNNSQSKLEKYWPLFQSAIFAPFEPSSLDKLQHTNLFSAFSGQYLDPEGYLFSENGRLLFLRVLPVKNYESMEIIAEPLQYIRQQLDQLRLKFPEVTVGITGRPVLQNDEATSTQSDSELAGFASFLLVAILFFVFFKSYKRSLFSLLSLFIGICWTTGFISITFGTINLISIVFTIILIGLGIDYGIHYLIRYQKERFLGYSSLQSIENTTTHTGSAVILGAVTSAVAFATAVFTDFLGLQQLGIIAGTGIIFCCLTQLTVFPALLFLFDQKDKMENYQIPAFGKFWFLFSRPKTVLVLAVLFTLLCVPFALKTGFNNNLLSLQDQSLESIRFEKIIQDNSDFSTWFLSYKSKDLKSLRQLNQQLQKLSTVKKTDSIITLLPDHQAGRINTIRELSSLFSNHDKTDPELKAAFENLLTQISNLSASAFSSGMIDEFNELNNLHEKLTRIHDQFLKDNNSTAPLNNEFMSQIQKAQSLFWSFLTPSPLVENQLPDSLLKTYKSRNGFYSLTIYPKENIWDPNKMESFIQDVQKVIPEVTGAPITHHESAKRMIRGFVVVAILTSIIVLALIYWEFKEISTTLYVFLNLIVSLIWLAAFMEFKGIHINLANFFALPVLIGSGVDHGIHIFHRFQETRSIKDLLTSIVPAVTLSCLTTIFGFASLALVRHNGLASFGLIMAVGTFLILISSVIILPNVVRILSRDA